MFHNRVCIREGLDYNTNTHVHQSKKKTVTQTRRGFVDARGAPSVMLSTHAHTEKDGGGGGSRDGHRGAQLEKQTQLYKYSIK